MTGYSLLASLSLVAAATAAWMILHHFGDRAARYYAMPVAAAILLVGLDWFYDIPLYAYLLGVLIAPILFHGNVRRKLERHALGLRSLDLPELGVRLESIPDPSGSHLALWRAAPAAGASGPGLSPAAGPRPAPASGPEAGPGSLILALDFFGETEDEYEVALWGEAPAHVPVELVVHHREGMGSFTRILRDHDPIANVREAEAWGVIRAQPVEFAFQALDYRVLAWLQALFALRSEEREIYVHVEGRVVRIGATRSMDRGELLRFLTVGACLIQRLREGCAAFAAGRPDR